MILNIISDLATPHNNDLISALRERPGIRVISWYALRRDPGLPWKDGLANSADDRYFDSFGESVRLLWRALTRTGERFLLVGYSNLPAKAILLAFWCMGRRLYYWTDHPAESGSLRTTIGRRIAYALLRRTASCFFVVGSYARRYFERYGFEEPQLIEQSIYIQPRQLRSADDIALIRKKFDIGRDKLLIVSGSRLTKSKGYDVLVAATALLSEDARSRSLTVIVGSGPERPALMRLAESAGISSFVRFVEWLEPQDYDALIGAADICIHPARFDAFGGGTLYGMANCVPVIASDGAGSAGERIVSGQNGLIYPSEDARRLADEIEELVKDPDLRRRLGKEGYKTAESCSPAFGAQKLHNAVVAAEGRIAPGRR